MSPYSLEIQETGIMSLYIENGVKLLLAIENEKIKTMIQPIYKELWKGQYIPKKEITEQQIHEWKKQLIMDNELELDKEVLDIARTHPRHAKNYNICSQSLHQIVYPQQILNKQDMRAYNNGLTFIGDAIIQFVLSIFLYHQLSETSTTEDYQNRLYLLKHNTCLSQIIKDYNFDSYLAYGKKQIPWYGSKMEKVQADLMKSFVGAIYESNGIHHLQDILEVVRKMVMPSSSFSFTKNKSYHYGIIVGFLFGIAIGISLSFIQLYEKIHTNMYIDHYEL